MRYQINILQLLSSKFPKELSLIIRWNKLWTFD